MSHPAHGHGEDIVLAVIVPVRILRFRILRGILQLGIILPLVLDLLEEYSCAVK